MNAHPLLISRRWLPVFALGVMVVVVRASPTLPQVRQAQAVLGSDIWSRIIAIENVAPRSEYPRELHALVFELAGLLWFYTPADGTQSFSLHRDALAEEKADFGPLLRAIEPGFRRWREVEAGDVAPSGTALPNGCFIESVVALRQRIEAGELPRRPRLLAYYVDTASGLKGHTVLAYEQGDEIAVVDTAQPGRTIRVSQERASDPLRLARAVEGKRVVRARELRLDGFARALAARVGSEAVRDRAA